MANNIHITFLGTSSAVPTETRNHSSILINYQEENILIDCGEGTQRQLRIKKLNPGKITRILITHLHGDHIYGLPGLFQTLSINNYKKVLYIYGPKGTKKLIENIFNIFIHGERIKVEVKEVNGKFFENEDFILQSYPLEHDTPCNGYIFLEKNKLRINKDKLKKLNLPNSPEIKKLIEGKNIKIDKKLIKYKELTFKEKGRKISFIFDTRLCPNMKKLAKDSNLSIIESTFLEDSSKGAALAKEYGHLTAKQAATIAKKENVKELILTHLSQRYEHKEKVILDEAKKVFNNTKLAHDLMTVKI
ncbi:MAG: ribonuclease Z [Candidatus Pacearchaeota archaeon]|jgi:ribonuclease Z